MPKYVEGELTAANARFAIVAARFNEFVTEPMLEGAIETLTGHGASDDDIVVFRVPGAFEIPVAAERVAMEDVYDAIICVGAVIRGDTPHFEYISAEVTRGIGEVALTHDIPVSFGVVTVDEVEHAVQRAGGEAGNKGSEAALAAIEMVQLFRQIGSE